MLIVRINCNCCEVHYGFCCVPAPSVINIVIITKYITHRAIRLPLEQMPQLFSRKNRRNINVGTKSREFGTFGEAYCHGCLLVFTG
jgi:hypothetical protein